VLGPIGESGLCITGYWAGEEPGPAAAAIAVAASQEITVPGRTHNERRYMLMASDA
jgi:hypothetical protein